MKKLLSCFVFTALMLFMAVSASALTLTNAYLIGTVEPGTPANEANELARLNYFISNYNSIPGSPGMTAVVLTASRPDTNTYTLVAGASVPSPLLPNAADYATHIVTGSFPVSVTNPYNYIMAKFGQDSAYYWLGGVTGSITIDLPTGWAEQGHGLSHVTLFGSTTTTVPEPGTLLLLGLGLLGVAGVRRLRK